MSEEKRLREAFKDAQELNKYIATLLASELTTKTLLLMSDWTIFQSSLATLKIPIGHIYRIFNIFHIDTEMPELTSPISSTSRACRANSLGQRSSASNTNVTDNTTIDDISEDYFTLGYFKRLL